MLNDDREYVPKWGELPVEQYMMRYWDFTSTESPNQQRLRLIRQFTDLDEIPREWDPVNYGIPPPGMPTAKEIEVILRPWRSDELRQKAWQILESGNTVPIFLRTHYKSGDDEKMEEWVNASQEFDNQAWWACLNDATLFNFGVDWQRVYIMPEAAVPGTSDIRNDRLWRCHEHILRPPSA